MLMWLTILFRARLARTPLLVRPLEPEARDRLPAQSRSELLNHGCSIISTICLARFWTTWFVALNVVSPTSGTKFVVSETIVGMRCVFDLIRRVMGPFYLDADSHVELSREIRRSLDNQVLVSIGNMPVRSESAFS